MIGAIVVLAILALIVFPAVLNMLNSSQGKVDKAKQNNVELAAKEYVDDHVLCYPKLTPYTYPDSCKEDEPRLDNNNLTVQKLLDEG